MKILNKVGEKKIIFREFFFKSVYIKQKKMFLNHMSWIYSAILSKILSTIQRKFSGSNASRIFPLIDKYLFLFLSITGGKIFFNWKNLKLLIMESNELFYCY